MDVKKGLLLVAMSLMSVGVGLILIGMNHYNSKNQRYSDHYAEIAASKCQDDETFRVERIDRGIRTYFNYYCDDAQGNSNNLIDEMSEEAPAFSDLTMTLAGSGVLVLAGLIAFFAVPHPGRHRNAH